MSAAGPAHAINLMARGVFPRSRFTGFDFSEAGIAAARARKPHAAAWRTPRFEQRDAARLDENARFRLRDHPSTRCTTRRGPDLMLAGDRRRPCGPAGIYLCVGHFGLEQAGG